MSITDSNGTQKLRCLELGDQTSEESEGRRGPPGAGLTHHVHHLWVYGLRDDIAIVVDVLHHLGQRRPLHLLPFEIAERIRQKVEENAALTQLLDEELLLLGRSHVWKHKKSRDQYCMWLD